MSRVRISTTVEAARLEECRRKLPGPDSVIVDRALQALLAEIERDAEIAALEAHPYEEDEELAWEVSDGPPLPYDGEVPARVLAMAKMRRKSR